MKFKEILVFIIGVLGVFLVHWWVCTKVSVIKNYGISLSIDWVNPLFLNIVFVLIMRCFFWRKKSFFLALILIGGLVNLGDRLIFGFVRDYWNFGGFLVNNLNDWLIGVGVLLFLVEIVWKK